MKIQVVRIAGIYMLKVIKGPLTMRLEGEYSSPAEAAAQAAREKCPGTAKLLGLNYF